MSTTVYFASAAKKRNSTLQATFNTSFDVVLKESTSIDRPTFILQTNSFDYNIAKWGDKYYFIDDVVSVKNNIWEVSCVLDVLATYKADILASTQYVAYSSVNSSIWLPDTRIPLKKEPVARTAQTSVTPLSNSGTYILSVVGSNGVASYIVSIADLVLLNNRLSNWINQLESAAENIMTGQATTHDAINELGKAIANTGFFGNSYNNAVQGIRGCVWVPFDSAQLGGVNRAIWIGDYDTGLRGAYINNTNIIDSFSITIPWAFSDWRRAVCEQVYLYLPLVGNIELSSDSIAHSDTLTISYSIAPITGEISYRINAGVEVIGTYGASAGADVPIGINQSASLGSIAQAAFNGTVRTVSAGSKGRMLVNGIAGVYDTINTAMTSNMTTIGGIGGSSGVGVGTSVMVSVVDHETLIAPSVMSATMGVPTMKPLTLSNCTGYCECINAHVAAAAQDSELDAIDSYLNSGFFIE